MGTNQIHEVLQAWANNFAVDVPAIHKDGQYLIEHDVLVNHINGLSYDELANILLEVEAAD